MHGLPGGGGLLQPAQGKQSRRQKAAGPQGGQGQRQRHPRGVQMQMHAAAKGVPPALHRAAGDGRRDQLDGDLPRFGPVSHPLKLAHSAEGSEKDAPVLPKQRQAAPRAAAHRDDLLDGPLLPAAPQVKAQQRAAGQKEQRPVSPVQQGQRAQRRQQQAGRSPIPGAQPLPGGPHPHPQQGQAQGPAEKGGHQSAVPAAHPGGKRDLPGRAHREKQQAQPGQRRLEQGQPQGQIPRRKGKTRQRTQQDPRAGEPAGPVARGTGGLVYVRLMGVAGEGVRLQLLTAGRAAAGVAQRSGGVRHSGQGGVAVGADPVLCQNVNGPVRPPGHRAHQRKDHGHGEDALSAEDQRRQQHGLGRRQHRQDPAVQLLQRGRGGPVGGVASAPLLPGAGLDGTALLQASAPYAINVVFGFLPLMPFPS